jgi:hypothetical protein
MRSGFAGAFTGFVLMVALDAVVIPRARAASATRGRPGLRSHSSRKWLSDERVQMLPALRLATD